MHEIVEAALRITSNIDVVCKAMVGRLSEEIGRNSPPSKRAISQFQVELVNLARMGAESFGRALEEELSGLARAQRDRASETTSAALSESLLTSSPATSALIERVESELRLYAAEGARVLNMATAQAAVSMSSGRTATSAMAVARNSFSARIRRWSLGSVGNAHAVIHRIFLATAEALQMVYVTEFVRAASASGAKVFRVSYPGHESDGLTFDADQIPFDVFHPQSGARVVVER